ncbi:MULTISPECIES: FHA domain-containing protein [Sorangium]|uniref:FHA domain-containing protein n=1 Tax=Sorangium TaxID=39643 RepID=UPI003D9C60B6
MGSFDGVNVVLAVVVARPAPMVNYAGAMGALKRAGFDGTIALGSRCLVGRHAGCDLRLDDPRISGEHAGLRWVDRAWELRDLGSKNGTFVGGRRLAPGERARLGEGDGFSVGGPEHAFTLIDGAPPAASARSTPGGRVRVASGGLLVLPDEENPRASVVECGGWQLETEEGARPVLDREVVVVDGEGWVLDLPSAAAATMDAEGAGPLLETIALRFGVTRDEEHVEVAVLHRGELTRVPPRTYHYLLLTLARRRLADRDASSAEQGWVESEALCKMLATDAPKLNVDIFRARKQLAALGIRGAAGVIARRPGTGMIRIGVEQLEVVQI